MKKRDSVIKFMKKEGNKDFGLEKSHGGDRYRYHGICVCVDALFSGMRSVCRSDCPWKRISLRTQS